MRDVVIASAFGLGPTMDAYAFALRLPNFFRNLLSEGALSASFVPIFSSFVGRGRTDDARRLAQGVLGFLLVASGLVVAVGVAAAPWIVPVLAPGFKQSTSDLAVRLVRILFPMSGIMVAGAWCLGVLTSHRRFFLPFAAPVVWNLAQIGGLLLGARFGWGPLVVVLAWSTLVGSILQVGIQLGPVRRLIGTVRPRIETDFEPTRRTLRNAGPVALGQGIFQISSLTDATLATLLVPGALGAMYFAQRIALLPLALFGVSVAVAALPEMSREGGIQALRPHIVSGVRRIAYFVIPAAVVLFLFGDLIVGIIYQRNQFTPEDVRVVQWILSAYALGLVASSLVKLFASAYHSLQDTRTPVKYAAAAVVTGIATGAGIMFQMRGAGYGPRAAAGLALGGALGAWINLGLLVRGLHRRGLTGWGRAVRARLVRSLLGAVAAGLVASALRHAVAGAISTGLDGRVLLLLLILGSGGAAYVAIAGIPGRGRGGGGGSPAGESG